MVHDRCMYPSCNAKRPETVRKEQSLYDHDNVKAQKINRKTKIFFNVEIYFQIYKKIIKKLNFPLYVIDKREKNMY
jgi:hypothetical protein